MDDVDRGGIDEAVDDVADGVDAEAARRGRRDCRVMDAVTAESLWTS